MDSCPPITLTWFPIKLHGEVPPGFTIGTQNPVCRSHVSFPPSTFSVETPLRRFLKMGHAPPWLSMSHTQPRRHVKLAGNHPQLSLDLPNGLPAAFLPAKEVDVLQVAQPTCEVLDNIPVILCGWSKSISHQLRNPGRMIPL